MNTGSGSSPLDLSGPAVDDRADWAPQKRSCYEWKDAYSVLVGVSWGKLPFELQQKWELYNCNDYMDCHTAACSYHSGTLDHYTHDHPVYQRPQSAADWEISNGFIPHAASRLKEKKAEMLKEKTGDLTPNTKQEEEEDEEDIVASLKEGKSIRGPHDEHKDIKNLDGGEDLEVSEFKNPDVQKLKNSHHNFPRSKGRLGHSDW